MERIEIFNGVVEILKEVFDNPYLKIEESTSANDIEGWDSLANMQLLALVQRKFKVKFSLMETISFGNVGDIVNALQSKL